MLVIIRGGGDLASGVALRLHRAGLRVVMTELAQPLAVRRRVCFSDAIYLGECSVEEVTARRVTDPTDTLRVLQILSKGHIAVLVDPEGISIQQLHPHVVVDARMIKQRVPLIPTLVKLIIGLGPGFVASENCHAVVETNRGHMLGRVIWQGPPEPDTGLPDTVSNHRAERVLRAPVDGLLETHAEICDHLEQGQLVAEVAGHKQAEDEIRKLNETLEQRISERTAELKKSIDQLEKFNRVFVDRELKMIELKERIAELEREA